MTNPIWQKGQQHVDATIQDYLAGEDVILDRHLFTFDIQASRAHAAGLCKIDILSEAEFSAIAEALKQLELEFGDGNFELGSPFEDGHSAIEHYLTEKLGDVGKKIHTGRSRNDQVQVAMRLYLRDRLDQLTAILSAIGTNFLHQAKQEQATLMPGYTHLQRAVPSTVGLWMAAMAEAFVDLVALSGQTRSWINSNPLGTAAGYGVNLPLDRDLTTKELGFPRQQINPMYVQNSRGRFELQVLMAFAQATLELRRFAWDLSLYSSQEFSFVALPADSQTGSSIMPNKRNPDLVELLRAQHAVVQGAMTELQSVLSLPSGYQRDLQATKGPTIRAIESSLNALALLPGLISGLKFNRATMAKAIEPDMLATDIAVEAAKAGQPFREAYRVAMQNEGLAQRSADSSIRDRVSPGACADLRLTQIADRLQRLKE